MTTQSTMTSDLLFNLVSILYHSMRASATYSIYIEDAEKANDTTLAAFFRDVRDGESQRAERAKIFLAERLASVRANKIDAAAKDSFPASDAPAH